LTYIHKHWPYHRIGIIFLWTLHATNNKGHNQKFSACSQRKESASKPMVCWLKTGLAHFAKKILFIREKISTVEKIQKLGKMVFLLSTERMFTIFLFFLLPNSFSPSLSLSLPLSHSARFCCSWGKILPDY
jgi:hypothetical protein